MRNPAGRTERDKIIADDIEGDLLALDKHSHKSLLNLPGG